MQISSYQRQMAMFALMTTVTLASLDTTITNTALPNIVKELHASETSVIWIANAYQIAMIATLLSFSALAESIGYRRIYIGGLLVFCMASLVCGLSFSLDLLIVGRVFQGVGAAAIMSINTAFIRHIYPPEKLGKGISLNALVVAVGFAIGPLCASIILSFSTWHWLFLLNLPIGIIALILLFYYLPSIKGQGLHFDLLASVLCSAFFGLFTFSLCSIQNQGNSIAILFSVVMGVSCLIGLLRRQANHAAPILATDLLKVPIIGLSSLTAICAFATQALALVSLPFLFENTLSISIVSTGFLLTTWPVMVAIMAIVMSRLSDRFSAGILCTMGLLVLSFGMFSLTILSSSTEPWSIVWRLIICGLGFGLFQAPNMKAIMANAPHHRSGGASGIVAISRLLGQTCGAALVAQCFNIWSQQGPEMALWLGSFSAGLGSIFSFLRLRRKSSLLH